MAEQIVVDLISPKNLELKTRIPNPLAMSVLDSVETYIEIEFGKVNAKMYREFLKYFRTNSISYKGLSREEVIKALGAGAGLQMEGVKKLSEKLLGR